MRRLIKALNHLEEAALALTLLGLALLACVQVAARYVWGVSFSWFEELSRYLGVFLAFLGAGVGMKRGLHFSMDLLVRRASPGLARAMGLASGLIGAAFFLTLAWYSWQHAMKLMRFGVVSAAMQLPMYWFYLPMPLFSLVLAARGLIHGWRPPHAAPPPPADPAAEPRP